MKILITGVNGFVGHYLISALNEHFPKATLVGIGRQAKGKLPDYHVVDLINRLDVKNALDQIKPDIIIHLAAVSSVGDSWKKPLKSFNNNVNIFLNIVEGIRELKLNTRILSVGSSEQYGIVKKESLPINENCALNPISPYAVARVSQEMLAKLYSTAFNLDIILTRSFNHFGARQEPKFVISAFAKQFAEIKLGKRAPNLNTGDLSIIRDFVDVRDVVNAYCLSLKHGKSGEVYNVCSGNGCSLKEIVQKLETITGIEVTLGIDSNLIRPNDNPVIIGDYSKIKAACKWSPKYQIENSLEDIYSYWLKELA